MSTDTEASVLFLLGQDVLCLAEVSSMAFPVEAPYDEATTHASGILPRDENERCGDIDTLDRDEAINARDSEWCVLHLHELFQNLVVERKLVNVIDAIGIGAHQLRASANRALHKLGQSHLDPLGQVQREREVERLVILECLYHPHERLVCLIDDIEGCCVG